MIHRQSTPTDDPRWSPRRVGWGAVALGLLTLWELTYPLRFLPQASGAWLGETQLHKINFAGNLALMVPWAVLLAWWQRARGHGWARAVSLTVLAVAGLSLLGETLQLWLPERHSSRVDLAANICGGAVGAATGWALAPWLEGRLAAVWEWLTGATRPRRLAWALAAMLLVRLAPFDVAPETRELRLSLYRTLHAGWPWQFTRRWLAAGAGSGSGPAAPSGADGQAAAMEMLRSGVTMALFAWVAWAMAAAIRQRFEAKADRSSPAGPVLLMAGVLVVATEAVQGGLRSRTADATDLMAGLVGVAMGVGLETLASWRRRATGEGEQ